MQAHIHPYSLPTHIHPTHPTPPHPSPTPIHLPPHPPPLPPPPLPPPRTTFEDGSPVPDATLAFFTSNERPCADLLRRMRPTLLHVASLAGHPHAALHHGVAHLDTLRARLAAATAALAPDATPTHPHPPPLPALALARRAPPRPSARADPSPPLPASPSASPSTSPSPPHAPPDPRDALRAALSDLARTTQVVAAAALAANDPDTVHGTHAWASKLAAPAAARLWPAGQGTGATASANTHAHASASLPVQAALSASSDPRPLAAAHLGFPPAPGGLSQGGVAASDFAGLSQAGDGANPLAPLPTPPSSADAFASLAPLSSDCLAFLPAYADAAAGDLPRAHVGLLACLHDGRCLELLGRSGCRDLAHFGCWVAARGEDAGRLGDWVRACRGAAGMAGGAAWGEGLAMGAVEAAVYQAEAHMAAGEVDKVRIRENGGVVWGRWTG